MVGLSLTGTSVNPARSLGPAVLTGFVEYHWIYWVGPVLGSLLAFGIYKGLLEQEQSITPNQGEEMNNASTGNF
jgi:aquaporin rerated protein, other eukaryote